MRVETNDQVTSNELEVSVYSKNQDELNSTATITAVRNELENRPEYSEIYLVGQGGNHAKVDEIEPSKYPIRSEKSTGEYYVMFMLK